MDAHGLGDLWALVDVDLDQADLAAGGGDRLLDSRAELLAGTAPWRPEIDNHRDLHGRSYDIPLEVLGVAVLDKIVAGRGRRYVLGGVHGSGVHV